MRPIPKTQMLTGQRLADTLALAHPLSVENPGKVRATYIGGGWIEISGSGLKPHPDLADQFPNGWSLLDRMRASRAREIIRSAVTLPEPEPPVFKKGDLVWWHAPSDKFWGIVSRFWLRRGTKMVYVVSDSGGFDADINTLSLASMRSIIRHQKKQYGHSPKMTRNSVNRAIDLAFHL